MCIGIILALLMMLIDQMIKPPTVTTTTYMYTHSCTCIIAFKHIMVYS